jgi:hypothetical protein
MSTVPDAAEAEPTSRSSRLVQNPAMEITR